MPMDRPARRVRGRRYDFALRVAAGVVASVGNNQDRLARLRAFSYDIAM